MSSPRTRFACAACTRRKVKCSKTVPCSHCVRRGEQDTCASEPATPRPTATPHATSIISPPVSAADHREVEALRTRVLELESQLRVLELESQLQKDRAASVAPRPGTAHSYSLPTTENNNDSAVLNQRESFQPVTRPDDVSRSTDGPDAVMKDAASILEFLAWGRKMNPDYNVQLSPEASANVGPDSGDVCDAEPGPSFPDVLDGDSQIGHLQLLLPSKQQLWELVHYHAECLLWYHCSYYAPSFQRQMEVFYGCFHGAVDSRGVNLQWLALLFAVITGSITCAPDRIAQSWGFRPAESETLSRRWCRAVYTCLGAAEYGAHHSILSVQAVSTLTISAHLLGFSNLHSIHMAAVIRVAQGLGLHRISQDSPGSAIDKESGRRLWSQLCCQDWFSIPFSDTYLINPLYSQSAPPINCHDEELVPLPEAIPTMTTYCRILTRIGSIMPRLQDDLVSCNTPYTKYEQIIKWDKRMRALSTTERPFFLSNVPINPTWPQYIPWARRSLAVTSAHKIIMIHRSFLSESFTNSAFSFTRRTCLAASKTIIKKVKAAMDDNEPKFWIYQAFSVAASIILILDMLHRNPTEVEYTEHRKLAGDALNYLSQCENSMIATRGVKLLSALLDEISVATQTFHGRKRRHDEDEPIDTLATRQNFNVIAFVKTFSNGRKYSGDSTVGGSGALMRMGCENMQMESRPSFPTTMDPALMTSDMRSAMSAPLDFLSWQDPGVDLSMLPQALESSTPFENLLFLANHDFTFMGT